MFLEHRVGGRVLDVGCGNGSYLLRMADLGWETVGVDPDAAAVSVARARGLTAIQGTVESAELLPASFDAVTLVHVAEHLPDPIRTFQRCRQLLRPGGRLIVIVPNSVGRGSQNFGSAWIGWDAPRHLFHFSTRTLTRCCEKAGFRVAHVGTLARMTREFYAHSYDIRRNGSTHHTGQALITPWERMRVRATSLLANACGTSSPAGEEVFLIATNETNST
jgi:SAM-dependent methyltransferase